MTTIKDAPVVELLIGTEKFPISDGSGEPVTATIQLIMDKCSGIPIVDSEDKLDPNALLGSLGVVAYNTVTRVSVRDLYQPTTDDIDQSTGSLRNPEKLSKVDKLEFTFPEGIHAGDTLSMALCTRTFTNVLLMGITSDNGVIRNITFAELTSLILYELCQYSENGVPSINQENIDILNNMLATDDWCYLNNPEAILTEAQFDIFDKFFKVVSGSLDTTLYINKPEGYKNIFEPESTIDKITGNENILINNDGKLSTTTVNLILYNTNTRLDNVNTRLDDTNNGLDGTNTKLNLLGLYKDGVYAVTADGKLIDYNLANTTATGVALVAGEHQFIIAKYDVSDGMGSLSLYWGGNLFREDVAGVVNNDTVNGTNSDGYLPKSDGSYYLTPNLSGDFTTWTTGALSDFNGKANTDAIINGYTEHGVSMETRDMCSVLNTFNASDSHNDWYVPACGLLALMYLHMTEINAALDKILGNTLDIISYWSSSECSTSNAWSVNFSSGYTGSYGKLSDCKVRFIRDISSISKRVFDLELNIYTKSEIDNMIISTLNTEV